MALKLLKVNVSLEVKGDPNDQDDLRNRVHESLQVLIESEELEFSVNEDESEELDWEE
jgi:hypothetical protein